MNKLKLFAAMMIATTTASTALAVTGENSWDQIRADNSVRIVSPLPGYELPRTEGIFNMCATADEIKSISPVTVCVQTVEKPGPHGEVIQVCVRSEARTVSQPRNFVAQKCAAWKVNPGRDGDTVCTKWESVPGFIDSTFSVEVVGNLDHNYMKTLFYKNYSIPSCN